MSGRYRHNNPTIKASVTAAVTLLAATIIYGFGLQGLVTAVVAVAIIIVALRVVTRTM